MLSTACALHSQWDSVGTSVQHSCHNGYPIGNARNTVSETDVTECAVSTVVLEGMVGMAVGETRVLRDTVPDTWWETSMRGSSLDCTVTLKEVFSWELPEVLSFLL